MFLGHPFRDFLFFPSLPGHLTSNSYYTISYTYLSIITYDSSFISSPILLYSFLFIDKQYAACRSHTLLALRRVEGRRYRLPETQHVVQSQRLQRPHRKWLYARKSHLPPRHNPGHEGQQVSLTPPRSLIFFYT